MWYRKYGMKANPFVIQSNLDIFVGFDDIKEKIFEAIESNDISLITGPFGSGKTSLLLWFRKVLRESGYTPIYLDGADFQLARDLRELYQEISSHIKGGFFENLKDLFTRREKKVVFLIDEANSIPTGLGEILKADKDRGFIYSIVFASADSNLLNLSPSIKHRIVENILLRPMSFEEAIGMIERRVEAVGGKNPFHPQALKYICEVSRWLPRDILKNCEIVAKELAERKKDLSIITEKDVKEVLKLKVKKKRKSSARKSKIVLPALSKWKIK
jgi:energy-coupling factor transporter ATP-binding protein EcfA2